MTANHTQATFLAHLYTQPPRRSDATIVLCGEDALARVECGLQLFRMGGGLLVLSGGKHAPPLVRSALDLYPHVLGQGVAADRVLVESESQHTGEQADWIAAQAAAEGWRYVTVVASSYHLPRAFLTCLAALPDPAAVRLIPMASAQSRWTEAPPGGERTRAELWAVELGKLRAYQAVGDCASEEDGVRYLQEWETRKVEMVRV